MLKVPPYTKQMNVGTVAAQGSNNDDDEIEIFRAGENVSLLLFYTQLLKPLILTIYLSP
jgi:hypothetical protein